jgi:hypothetical protein
LTAYPPHTTAYIHYAAKSAGSKTTKQQKLEMAANYFYNLKQAGIKTVLTRATNEKLKPFMQSLGFKVLNEVKFENKGQLFPNYLIEMDLENPLFLGLIKKQSKAKLQPKPKL